MSLSPQFLVLGVVILKTKQSAYFRCFFVKATKLGLKVSELACFFLIFRHEYFNPEVSENIKVLNSKIPLSVYQEILNSVS